jgi:hypothetical protein
MKEQARDGRARLRLAVTVSYDLNGRAAADLERQLLGAADRLADEGLLSGETGADVAEWDAKVEELR